MANINVRDYIDERYGLFINNEFQQSETGETIKVTNPANGEDLAEVAKASKKMWIKQLKRLQTHLIVGVKFQRRTCRLFTRN